MTNPSPSLQTSLNALLTILNPRTLLYLLLRRPTSLVAITFVPYLADQTHREWFLEHRHTLVKHLGEELFEQSLICKEIGEITDVRSWEERGLHSSTTSQVVQRCQDDDCNECVGAVKDLGYKKNKCRLCDRRMQNPISPDALAALQSFHSPGDLVQLVRLFPLSLPSLLHHRLTRFAIQSITPNTLTLSLILSKSNILPTDVSTHIPTTYPTYTFYHHTSSGIYFIFHSPDTSPVKSRMTHTMGIPGLLVHAEDVGVKVGSKVEIHEPEELSFVGEDGVEEGGGGRKGEKMGKYRSMYNRQGFMGTELMYEGLEGDKEFLDALR
jgi:twinfilin-like protein